MKNKQGTTNVILIQSIKTTNVPNVLAVVTEIFHSGHSDE